MSLVDLNDYLGKLLVSPAAVLETLGREALAAIRRTQPRDVDFAYPLEIVSFVSNGTAWCLDVQTPNGALLYFEWRAEPEQPDFGALLA